MAQNQYNTLILKRIEDKFESLLPYAGIIALLSSVVILYSPIPNEFAYLDGSFGVLFFILYFLHRKVSIEIKIMITIMVPLIIGIYSFMDGGFTSACITLFAIANVIAVLLLSKPKSMMVSVVTIAFLCLLWFWSYLGEKGPSINIGFAKWIIQITTFALYLLMQHSMVYAIRIYLLEIIQDLEDSIQQTYELAYFDQLTGLPNQYEFKYNLSKWISDNHLQGTMLFLSVKNLSLINTLYGEAVGDTVLLKIAEVFGNLKRENELLARLGGNEFGFWLVGTDDIQIRIDTLISVFHEQFKVPDMFQKIEFHIGYALFNKEKGSVLETYKNGIVALTYAKTHQLPDVVHYDDSLEATIRFEESIKEQLSEAIKNDEFILVYQEKVNGITGKVLGLEALARWHNEILGDIKPDVFIPIIEKNNLAISFGEYIIDKVLQDYDQIREKYKSNLSVSINISPSQLMSDGFIDYIAGIIKKYEVNAENIILEITENVLIEGIDLACEIVDRIKKTGVKVSLDDFGTGYSSLNYLTKLRIDELKIDKSFISEIGINKMNDNILEVLVKLSKDNGLDLVVEGVETEEQLNIVIEMGCVVIQGYYFSKPEPL